MIMMMLIDIGVNFWVGSLFWPTFIFPFVKREDQAQQAIVLRVEQRFERYFALSTLLLLLLFHIVTVFVSASPSNNVETRLLFMRSPSSNENLASSWIARIAILLMALVATSVLLLFRHRSQIIDNIITWINVALGLALLVAVTLSSNTTITSATVGIVLGSWLHLFCACVWVGSILYIAIVYLPILKENQQEEQVRSLLSVLPCVFPLLGLGMVGTVLSGVFSTSVHGISWLQLFLTLYGRLLLVKETLVGALLVIGAVQVFWMYPRLAKAYTSSPSTKDLPQQKESQEKQLLRLTPMLIASLRWEALLTIAIILYASILPFVASTLLPTAVSQRQTQQKVTTVKPFKTSAKTTDGLLTVTLTVNPNVSGANIFTVSIQNSEGIQTTQAQVLLSTKMLEMDMGTNTIMLQADGKGHFSGDGDLGMGGIWLVRVQIRTTNGVTHEVIIKLITPS